MQNYLDEFYNKEKDFYFEEEFKIPRYSKNWKIKLIKFLEWFYLKTKNNFLYTGYTKFIKADNWEIVDEPGKVVVWEDFIEEYDIILLQTKFKRSRSREPKS